MTGAERVFSEQEGKSWPRPIEVMDEGPESQLPAFRRIQTRRQKGKAGRSSC